MPLSGALYIGESVYIWWEIVPLRASGGAYGAVGGTAYAGVGKGTAQWRPGREKIAC